LLELLIKYLGGGRIEKQKTSVVNLTLTNLSLINNIIIPLFKKYPLLGIKQLDFLD
jgi:hypothetical protein